MKERLAKLKEEIDLDKPGNSEALLDSVASELLKSGLVEPMPGAPSLWEVLEKMKGKYAVPAEIVDAAKNLAYLIEEDWYDETPDIGHKVKADQFASVVCDKLTPLLDGYGQG